MGVLPVGRLLAGMAVPMMISMLVQACYNVVDSVFVAQLSQDALNAVSLAFPIQNLLIAVSAGTCVGVNALLSRSLGEKKQEMADRAAGTGIFLSLCSFVVFALIGLFLSRPFFLAQTKNEVIVEYGTQYATVCLGLSIGVFSQFCFERLLQSTGRTFYAMCTQLTGAVINIVLDPILIFGYFGAPRLEVVGAAVATVAGQIVAAIIAVIINIKRNPDIHIRLREIRWNRVVAGEIYRVGLPTIVMQAIGSVMTFAVNGILLGVSSTAVAFFGIYYKLQNFLMMPVNGLGQAAIPVVGFNYGSGQSDRVNQAWKVLLPTGVVFALCGTAVFLLFPVQLLGLFSASDEMLAFGVPALRIISVTFLFAVTTILCGYFASGLGNGVVNMIGGALRQLVVLVPCLWLLIRTMGIEKAWFAFWVSEVVACAYSLWATKKELRNKGK